MKICNILVNVLSLIIAVNSGVPRGWFGGFNPPPPNFRNFDKVPKIKKILLNEIKILVPNYSCLQNPWLGGHCPQIPVLSVQTEFVEPPPNKIPGYATDCTDYCRQL
jgi:hypothetical protein